MSFLFVSIYIVYDLDAHPIHQYITLPRYRKYLCCKKAHILSLLLEIMVQLARCYQALFSFQLWLDIVLVLLFSLFIYLEVKSAFLSLKKRIPSGKQLQSTHSSGILRKNNVHNTTGSGLAAINED